MEVDYDSGTAFNNAAIAWSAALSLTKSLVPFYRKISKLMRKHKPAYCLSFWEPGVATFINVMRCPTKLVSVASQGQIYADDSGSERGPVMRALHWLNVGDRGTLVPLSVRPLPGAIPQVIAIPPHEPAVL